MTRGRLGSSSVV
jgi:hypothetical protein